MLDVGLPSEKGLNIAKGIRIADKLTPIIFLTALSMPEDVLNGFKAGGNDYLKKPFDLEELIIRIKVLLNQNRLFEHEGLKTISDYVLIGQFTFDTKKNLLSHPDIVRKLTAREAEVLNILYQNRNQLLARRNLLIEVWGDDDFFSSRSLDVYISKMRKYFKKDNNVQIINNRGFGYKFVF